MFLLQGKGGNLYLTTKGEKLIRGKMRKQLHCMNPAMENNGKIRAEFNGASCVEFECKGKSLGDL